MIPSVVPGPKKHEEPTVDDLPRLKREAADIELQLQHRGGNGEWRARAHTALRVKLRQIQMLELKASTVFPRGDFDALLAAYNLLKRLMAEVDLEPDEVKQITQIELHLRSRSVG